MEDHCRECFSSYCQNYRLIDKRLEMLIETEQYREVLAHPDLPPKKRLFFALLLHKKYDAALELVSQAGSSFEDMAVSAVLTIVDMSSSCDWRGNSMQVDFFNQLLALIHSRSHELQDGSNLHHYEFMTQGGTLRRLLMKVIDCLRIAPDSALFNSILDSDLFQFGDELKTGYLLEVMLKSVKSLKSPYYTLHNARLALEARKCFALCVRAGMNLRASELVYTDTDYLSHIEKRQILEVCPFISCVQANLYDEALLLYRTGIVSTQELPRLWELSLDEPQYEKMRTLISTVLSRPQSLETQCCVAIVRCSRQAQDRTQWATQRGVPEPLIWKITFQEAVEEYETAVEEKCTLKNYNPRTMQLSVPRLWSQLYPQLPLPPLPRSQLYLSELMIFCTLYWVHSCLLKAITIYVLYVRRAKTKPKALRWPR